MRGDDTHRATISLLGQSAVERRHIRAGTEVDFHPAHRRRGYVSGAVRLAVRFLGDHTSVRQVHIVVDQRNTPSLRVAAAVGATEIERFAGDEGHVMVRHVLAMSPPEHDGQQRS
ncbi:MAG: GNAT family N-acetyltransferase [Acidimicrobiales bacterium]